MSATPTATKSSIRPELSPFATANKLTDAQLGTLHDAMIAVLTDAVTRSVGQTGSNPEGREAIRAACACPHRSAVPGVRRHGAGGGFRRQVVSVLPDLPDRRQGAGRQTPVQAAQVATLSLMTRQKILITGASSGLGAGMARAFAAKGRDLALCARRTGRLDELKAELTARHPGITVAVETLDVNDHDQVPKVFAKLVRPAAWCSTASWSTPASARAPRWDQENCRQTRRPSRRIWSRHWCRSRPH